MRFGKVTICTLLAAASTLVSAVRPPSALTTASTTDANTSDDGSLLATSSMDLTTSTPTEVTTTSSKPRTTLTTATKSPSRDNNEDGKADEDDAEDSEGESNPKNSDTEDDDNTSTTSLSKAEKTQVSTDPSPPFPLDGSATAARRPGSMLSGAVPTGNSRSSRMSPTGMSSKNKTNTSSRPLSSPPLGTASSGASSGDPVASPPPSAASKRPSIIPCQQGSGSIHGCGKCKNDSSIEIESLQNAKLNDFDSSYFPAKDDSAGGRVFFNIPAPEPGCKTLVFSELPDMSPPLNVPGLLSIIAGQAGCYFMVVKSKVAVASCCGNEECGKIGLGAMGYPADIKPLGKDTSSASQHHRRTSPGAAPEVAQPNGPAVPTSAPTSDPNPTSSGGSTAPAPIIPPAPKGGWTFFNAKDTFSSTTNMPKPEIIDKWCDKAVPLGSMHDYTRAGPMVLLGEKTQCSGEICSFSVEYSMASTGSIDVSGSSEQSKSDSVSASLQVGYGLGWTALATAGYEHGWSSAITNSTSFTNSTSKTNSLSSTLGVERGTFQQLAVSQQLKCSMFTSQCHDRNGTAPKFTTETCQPDFYDDNHEHPRMVYFTVTLL